MWVKSGGCRPDISNEERRKAKMGILKRIKTIVAANINHMIEKAEDPEKMIKQFIREMDETIVSLRMEVAKAIAAEKRLAHRISETQQKIQNWQENSERAVREDNEDLARQALAHRLSEEKALVMLEEQYQKAKALSQLMKDDLAKLEDKIQEARRKKEILIARKRSAEAQKSLLKATNKFAAVAKTADTALDRAKSDAPLAMDALEDRILEMETESEALREVMKSTPSLEADFEEAKEQDRIEKELEQIKQKVKNEKTK
jgi:phage shock protein A